MKPKTRDEKQSQRIGQVRRELLKLGHHPSALIAGGETADLYVHTPTAKIPVLILPIGVDRSDVANANGTRSIRLPVEARLLPIDGVIVGVPHDGWDFWVADVDSLPLDKLHISISARHDGFGGWARSRVCGPQQALPRPQQQPLPLRSTPKVLSAPAVAKMLGCSQGTVRSLAKRGKIPHQISSSGQYVFKREDVESFHFKRWVR